MDITTEWLSTKILEFISVLNTCLSGTSFAEDRHIYADDIAAATNWLTRLHEGEQASSIAHEILEPVTAKQFTDYWRQGVWGEMESAALDALQGDIRKQELV